MAERMTPPDIEPASNEIGGRTPADWHQHLTGEDLDTPCSRYGRTASECAWWAVAALMIFEHYYPGELDSHEDYAENAMSMAVNDNSSLGPFVVEHRDVLPSEVVDNLTVAGGE